LDYSDTTVIIPVMNEPAAGKVAKETLRKLKGAQVLVVYKGDRKILNLDFKDKRMRIMKQTGSGKGVAVVQAVERVNTKIMCLIDGDATYDVDDLKTVIALVRKGAAMAIGDRLERVQIEAMPRFIQFGNKVITGVQNVLYGMKLRDSQTGLRAILTDVFRSLNVQEQFFGIETEMCVKVRKKGLRTEEVPINYYVRVGEANHMKLSGGIKLLMLDFKFLFHD
jgi:dolichol-phosphate hexosyltransferase